MDNKFNSTLNNVNKVKTKQNRARGFTMLELLITLGIVGIAATLALSSMTTLIGESSSEDFTRTLSKTVNFSRVQSVSTGQTVTLCTVVDGICANDWTQNITIFVDASNNRTLGTNTVLRIIDAIPSQDQLTYTGTALGISFYPDGSIGDSDNGVFTYMVNRACDLSARGVDVNNSGRARFVEQITCS
jgi:type IV fimbrial biogenesis protein FimT